MMVMVEDALLPAILLRVCRAMGNQLSNTVKQWLKLTNTCPVVWCVTIFGLECGQHSGTHPRIGSGLTERRPPLPEDMSSFLQMVVNSWSALYSNGKEIQ